MSTGNQRELIHSLLFLKDLFVRHADVDLDRIDQRQLYLQLVARLRREKGMPAVISRRLDETRLRIERLSDAVEMHALLITAIKDITYMKKPFVPQVHTVEYTPDPVFSSLSPPPTNVQQQKAAAKGGAVPKQKEQTKQRERGRGNKNKNKPKDNGSLQIKKKLVEDKNTRGRSKSRSRFFFVEQWPKGKRYLNKSGSALTAECDAWFNNFCFKCGHNSHSAEKCKTYQDAQTVLTLCETCMMGFHTKCKNYRYAVGPEARIHKIENFINNWGAGDSRGGGYLCPPFPQMGPQYLTNPFPANYNAMRPPPANQQINIVDIHHPQDEEDE